MEVVAVITSLFALVGALSVFAAPIWAQLGREEKRAVPQERPMSQMPKQPIEAVQEAHTKRLMALPGVVGTGIGQCNGKLCIKVYVVRRTPELADRIPLELEGYSVAIEETGEIRGLP